MDVGAWLRRLGLDQYEAAFRDNDIDAQLLPRLTAEDLIGLGVTSVGHRRKLLDAAAALRSGPELTGVTNEPRTATPLADTGERRQVAVLFADLVGYTALSKALDAEEVHALLDRFFDCADRLVEEHGGHIDKHIGDCVMAVFGAPTSHGNDAERAVRAALAIRDAMPALSVESGRQMRIHIGVAGGQVMASSSGSASHREYTVTGDTVNFASRLTDAAAADEILISETVWRALAGRLECVESGELMVKGVAEPVKAWRLLRLHELALSGRQPFIGRSGELQHFEAALTMCRRSRRGQAIYVRGEAGIGKTRLLEEFQDTAKRAGFACHGGLVLDFGMGTGRDAIRSLVRSILGLSNTSDRTSADAAAEQAVMDGLVSAERRVYLNDLLDLPQPIELRTLYGAMDNPARNRGKRATVAELVTRASGRQPRLLTVEDLHWADRATLDHLVTLTETVAESPALLVITSRTEGDQLDHGWRSSVTGLPLTTMDLGPLLLSEAEVLASGYLDTLGEVVQRCIARAEGNPLFLDQLLRHAEESVDSGLPASIQGLVQARLDRLAPMDKQALQAASVLGQRFTPEALGALLDQPRYDCVELVRHFLVRPQEGYFLFAHALIQESVYDSLLKVRRRELHYRAAEWFKGLDPTLHAEHLDRAEDAAAGPAYLEAARAQAAEYRAERALRLVERGLALAQARPDIYALTQFQGQLLHDLGLIQDSITAFEHALTVADSDIERCRALLGLTAGMRVTDRFDDAFAALGKAETMASAHGLTAELARIHHLRGNLYFPLGKLQECLLEHELTLDLAQKANVPELEARALGGLGDAEYARGRMASAYRYFSRCVELSHAHGSGRIEVANLTMVAHTQIYLNDFSGALATAAAAIELATRVGHSRAEIIAHNAAIWVYRTTGELERAKRHVERVQTLVRGLGARRFEAVNLNDRAAILNAQGRRSEALDLIQRGLAISRETGLGFMGPWILAHYAVTAEDPVARREALTEGEKMLHDGAVGHNHLWFFRYAIEASLRDCEWSETARYADALENYTRPEPLPWAHFFVDWGRTLAARGRDRHDHGPMRELRRLRHEAERLNLGTALPMIERALAPS
jgi:class 3 adenylate cyclase/tetratricopeptide (TPR) repeat protein